MDDIESVGDSEDQVVCKTLKTLRHFGAYLTKFDQDVVGYYDAPYKCTLLKADAERQHRIFESLIQYCSATLTELNQSCAGCRMSLY